MKKPTNFRLDSEPMRSLTAEDAADIRARIKRGQKRKDVRYIYNLTPAHLDNILKGRDKKLS